MGKFFSGMQSWRGAYLPCAGGVGSPQGLTDEVEAMIIAISRYKPATFDLIRHAIKRDTVVEV